MSFLTTLGEFADGFLAGARAGQWMRKEFNSDEEVVAEVRGFVWNSGNDQLAAMDTALQQQIRIWARDKAALNKAIWIYAVFESECTARIG